MNTSCVILCRVQGGLRALRQKQRRSDFAEGTSNGDERARTGHDATGSGSHDTGSRQRQCVKWNCRYNESDVSKYFVAYLIIQAPCRQRLDRFFRVSPHDGGNPQRH